MGTEHIRNGKGHRAYRRKQAALKRRTRDENLPCGYGSPSGWGCGEPIDTTLDYQHPLSFTADHDTPLGHGGTLLGQTLVPMHRRCNSRKNDHVAPDLDQWAAT